LISRWISPSEIGPRPKCAWPLLSAARTAREAALELRARAGSHLDPNVVLALLAALALFDATGRAE
jgi:hypothetical protein